MIRNYELFSKEKLIKFTTHPVFHQNLFAGNVSTHIRQKVESFLLMKDLNC